MSEREREEGGGQTERKIDAIKQEARKCKGEQSGARLGNRGWNEGSGRRRRRGGGPENKSAEYNNRGKGGYHV